MMQKQIMKVTNGILNTIPDPEKELLMHLSEDEFNINAKPQENKKANNSNAKMKSENKITKSERAKGIKTDDNNNNNKDTKNKKADNSSASTIANTNENASRTTERRVAITQEQLKEEIEELKDHIINEHLKEYNLV